MLDAGLSVTGIDISEVMLQLARRNVPQARLLGIPVVLGNLREVLIPGGLLALAMVEADLDDVPIDFLGGPIRVTGYPRDELADVVTDSGFEVTDLKDWSYAPASTQAPPEVQLFLYCRRI